LRSDQDVVNELRENYEFYVQFLVARVELLAQNKIWNRGDFQLLAGGWAPEDVAHHILLKTLSGERRYDPSKGLLTTWLGDQVRSVLSARVQSEANRHERDLPEDKIVDDGLFGNPEAVLIEKQNQEAVSHLVDQLYEAADNDPELLRMVDAIMDGCEPKPRFLAEELNEDVQYIKNLLKRLKRRGRKVIGHDGQRE